MSAALALGAAAALAVVALAALASAESGVRGAGRRDGYLIYPYLDVNSGAGERGVHYARSAFGRAV